MNKNETIVSTYVIPDIDISDMEQYVKNGSKLNNTNYKAMIGTIGALTVANNVIFIDEP